MEVINGVVNWYIEYKNYIDLVKDVIFAIGVIATFYGYFKFLKFLTNRRILNKRQEMENDAKLYSEIHNKLKDHVESYGATLKNLRDIGIRLLYMKNYPYNLNDDGFKFLLYYYFLTENHKPSGYISGKGIYVLEHIWYWGDAIYYNSKNGKWFMGKKGLAARNYEELKYKLLVKRIPYNNILGYDFDSDWADNGEPVFYTKYKYTNWKLYADELEAVTNDDGEYPLNHLLLNKSKRARKIRTLFAKLINIVWNPIRSELNMRKHLRRKNKG